MTLDDATYPTQEQAAAAATHQLGKVGDEVYLHQATCSWALNWDRTDKCSCTPTVMVLTLYGWRFSDESAVPA